MADKDFELEGTTSSGTQISDSAPTPIIIYKKMKTGGKKKGWKKLPTMTNGKFTEEDLFKYVPKDTLPTEDRESFIKLCDTMVIDLGTETVTETDLEDITLYYRDRLYCNKIYSTFAVAGVTDSNLVAQIEKLNKALEQRKSNLGARFADRGKKRKDSTTSSLMDLLASFQEQQKEFIELADKKNEEINENKKKLTNTKDYMIEHTANKLREERNPEGD